MSIELKKLWLIEYLIDLIENKKLTHNNVVLGGPVASRPKVRLFADLLCQQSVDGGDRRGRLLQRPQSFRRARIWTFSRRRRPLHECCRVNDDFTGKILMIRRR